MRKRVFYGFVFLFTFGIILNCINNRSIEVVNQEIKIDKLPEELRNFKILQISDLHGKTFGKNQKNLIDKINSLNYDVLIFTGDIIDDYSNTQELFNLIDNISNKKYAFWIKGNSLIKLEEYDKKTGELSGFGKELESHGIKVLNNIEKVEVGGKKVYFSDGPNTPEEPFEKYIPINEEDLSICLTHIPFENDYLFANYKTVFKYDLIVSGHYHGGQIRIPFYGAIFIPNATGDNAYFPNQKEVKGINYRCSVPQYISAGLGASSKFKFLSFRVCNKPEINLLIIK